MEKVSNWGKYPEILAKIIESSDLKELKKLIIHENKIIARGNGRCYGDSSLQKNIFSTLKLNKIIAFNMKESTIECESGVLLNEILKVIVPHSFFLPVTPGTKFVTVGGAIASNVHGKNQHSEGSISNYVVSFKLMNEFGEVITCSKNENINLYKKTIGGMGLTGVIISVKIKLKQIETSFIKTKTICVSNLDEMLVLFEKHKNATYAVAWLDGFSMKSNLGKGILNLGEHLCAKELKNTNKINKIHKDFSIKIPSYFPSFLLNNYTVSLMNKIIFLKKKIFKKENIKHYDSFFYPLDKISNWNNFYGKKGFLQYQFVIPLENSKNGILKILNKIESSSCKSYLIVMKNFGNQDEVSSLTFPMEGITLAMDFKFSEKVLDLFQELDEIVIEFKGRVYLTKDACLSKNTFNQMYKTKDYLNSKFSSIQSERLNY